MGNANDRRKRIKELFERLVYGPLFGEEEVLNTNPLNLYATGVICPESLTNETNKDIDIEDEMDDELKNNEEEGLWEKIEDEVESYSKQKRSIDDSEDESPKDKRYSVNISSFGVTFICHENIESLPVELSFFRYSVEEDPPFKAYEYNGEERIKKYYKYIAKKYTESFECKLHSDQESFDLIKDDNFVLKISSKIKKNDSKKIVSIFVSNQSTTTNYEKISLKSNKVLPLLIFRPVLVINIPEEKIYDNGTSLKIDFSDDKENEMLYRNYKRLGRGHNCAVYYNNGKLRTSFLPEQKTKWLNTSFDDQKYNSFIDIFSVDYLLEDNQKDSVIKKLNLLLDSYKIWINAKEIQESFTDQFNKNKKECESIKLRVEQGIKLLSEDKLIYSVWLDTHHAMKKQFEKSNLNQKLKYRPFQLVFLLMMIESIVNEKSDDRNIADLLWVPTGGGKTEAYLAVSAFTILYRRKKYGNNGHGLAVISRYTLRLLTAQQFERTAKLICALELIRKDKEQDYGTSIISLGLFIGGTGSPNLIKDASKKIEGRHTIDFPIQRCPWCGAKLENINSSPTDQGNSFYSPDEKKFYIICHNTECNFYSEKRIPTPKLPIQFVDEMMEKEPPSMIICTADKFAMMPFQTPKFKKIFMSSRPPELIIQDELHLIDSALGSIFGLYETTNSILWERDHKIKIIASTATPKEADTQLKLLFNRDTAIFPKPLSTIDDTFFTELKEEDHGRCYLGFMPSCTSAKNAMIITLTAFLAASAISKNEGIAHKDDYQNLYFFETDNDAYKMITCYFNSIRELGGTSASIDDEVASRLPEMLRYIYMSVKYENDIIFDYYKELKKLRQPNESKTNKKVYYRRNKYSKLNHFELTGRISNSDLIYQLSRLDGANKRLPDILMSTNMISVGIDIKDLNLMIVNGQPKKTAEYIQASSRTGRQKETPGIVLTLYNPVKLRDISFYEYFYSYHQTFYRYVEPVSVTPFSSQCLDRGLLAQMVSLMRNYEKGNNINLNPDAFDFDILWGKISEKITGDDDRNPKKRNEIESNYNKIKEKEIQRIKKVFNSINPMYAFGENKLSKQNDKHYLLKFNNERKEDEHLEYAVKCMTSFRDVSGECEIKIKDINYED